MTDERRNGAERKTIALEFLGDVQHAVAVYAATAQKLALEDDHGLRQRADALLVRLEYLCDVLDRPDDAEAFDQWGLVADLVYAGADFLADIAMLLEARGLPRPRRLLAGLDRCRDSLGVLAGKRIILPETTPYRPRSAGVAPVPEVSLAQWRKVRGENDDTDEDEHWARNALPRLRPDDWPEDEDEEV